MAMFQPFRKATQAEAPKLLAAKIADSQAKAHARALRNKTVMDAGTMYNVGMGDRSPIYDSVFGGAETAGAEAAIPEMIAAPTAETMATVVPSGGETLLAETMAGAAPETAMALGEGVLAPTAATAATEAGALAGGEALAGEALASGALTAGAETAGGGALAGALGAAGTALPPLMMAALLSRALGMWS